MNFLHESVIGNFENCPYFYSAGYIDPRLWRALFLRVEPMLKNTGIFVLQKDNEYKYIKLEEEIIFRSIRIFEILSDLCIY